MYQKVHGPFNCVQMQFYLFPCSDMYSSDWKGRIIPARNSGNPSLLIICHSAMHSPNFQVNFWYPATLRPNCADRVLVVRDKPVTSTTCVTTPLEKTVIAPLAGYDDPPTDGIGGMGSGRCILSVAQISASALLDPTTVGCYPSCIHSHLSQRYRPWRLLNIPPHRIPE